MVSIAKAGIPLALPLSTSSSNSICAGLLTHVISYLIIFFVDGVIYRCMQVQTLNKERIYLFISSVHHIKRLATHVTFSHFPQHPSFL